MNKKIIVISVLGAALVFSGLASCLSNKEPVDIHNAKISSDWEGVYTGTIPSAGGSGINVRLKLNKDESFELRYIYVDKPDNPFNQKGSFKWDDTGSIIILNADKETPPYYFVGENKLIQLDMKGKRITGKLANDYVLNKER